MENDCQVNIRLPGEFKREAEAFAADLGLSLSEYIRQLIEEQFGDAEQMQLQQKKLQNQLKNIKNRIKNIKKMKEKQASFKKEQAKNKQKLCSFCGLEKPLITCKHETHGQKKLCLSCYGEAINQGYKRLKD